MCTQQFELLSYLILTCLPGKQRHQLLMVFALSVRYKTVDVSLAVSCGILPLLLQLCKGNTLLTENPNRDMIHNDLGPVIKIASMNLLQILAVTSRSAFTFNVLLIHANQLY